MVSNLAALGAFKPYPLKVAFLSEELSNAIPSCDVAGQGCLSVAFKAFPEVVGDAVGVYVVHIVSCKCWASPSLVITSQPLAGHKAVHALVGFIW